MISRKQNLNEKTMDSFKDDQTRMTKRSTRYSITAGAFTNFDHSLSTTAKKRREDIPKMEKSQNPKTSDTEEIDWSIQRGVGIENSIKYIELKQKIWKFYFVPLLSTLIQNTVDGKEQFQEHEVRNVQPIDIKKIPETLLKGKFSTQCTARIASNLPGTTLRKNITKKFMSMNSDNNSDLRNFHGHNKSNNETNAQQSITIKKSSDSNELLKENRNLEDFMSLDGNLCRQSHRHPVEASDILKISKLLEAAQESDEGEDSY